MAPIRWKFLNYHFNLRSSFGERRRAGLGPILSSLRRAKHARFKCRTVLPTSVPLWFDHTKGTNSPQNYLIGKPTAKRAKKWEVNRGPTLKMSTLTRQLWSMCLPNVVEEDPGVPRTALHVKNSKILIRKKCLCQQL